MNGENEIVDDLYKQYKEKKGEAVEPTPYTQTVTEYKPVPAREIQRGKWDLEGKNLVVSPFAPESEVAPPAKTLNPLIIESDFKAPIPKTKDFNFLEYVEQLKSDNNIINLYALRQRTTIRLDLAQRYVYPLEQAKEYAWEEFVKNKDDFDSKTALNPYRYYYYWDEYENEEFKFKFFNLALILLYLDHDPPSHSRSRYFVNYSDYASLLIDSKMEQLQKDLIELNSIPNLLKAVNVPRIKNIIGTWNSTENRFEDAQQEPPEPLDIYDTSNWELHDPVVTDSYLYVDESLLSNWNWISAEEVAHNYLANKVFKNIPFELDDEIELTFAPWDVSAYLPLADSPGELNSLLPLYFETARNDPAIEELLLNSLATLLAKYTQEKMGGGSIFAVKTLSYRKYIYFTTEPPEDEAAHKAQWADIINKLYFDFEAELPKIYMIYSIDFTSSSNPDVWKGWEASSSLYGNAGNYHIFHNTNYRNRSILLENVIALKDLLIFEEADLLNLTVRLDSDGLYYIYKGSKRIENYELLFYKSYFKHHIKNKKTLKSFTSKSSLLKLLQSDKKSLEVIKGLASLFDSSLKRVINEEMGSSLYTNSKIMNTIWFKNLAAKAYENPKTPLEPWAIFGAFDELVSSSNNDSDVNALVKIKGRDAVGLVEFFDDRKILHGYKIGGDCYLLIAPSKMEVFEDRAGWELDPFPLENPPIQVGLKSSTLPFLYSPFFFDDGGAEEFTSEEKFDILNELPRIAFEYKTALELNSSTSSRLERAYRWSIDHGIYKARETDPLPSNPFGFDLGAGGFHYSYWKKQQDPNNPLAFKYTYIQAEEETHLSSLFEPADIVPCLICCFFSVENKKYWSDVNEDPGYLTNQMEVIDLNDIEYIYFFKPEDFKSVDKTKTASKSTAKIITRVETNLPQKVNAIPKNRSSDE